MLRVSLGMPIVNVSLVDTPSCGHGADKCKKPFGGDMYMLSGSHWDSICWLQLRPLSQHATRHDLVCDIWYKAFIEVSISVQCELKGL